MPRRRVWILVFLFLLATINYVDRVALSVAAAPISAELGIDKVQLGYLFSSFLWLYVVCLVPMGWLVDRLGTRAVNAGGMALWSAATVATGMVASLPALIATRVVMGIGEATTYPAAGRVIREWVPARERALATTIFNAGAYFGPAVGGLVLASLVASAGWRAAFYACGAIGFIWLAAWLIWFRQPEEARWLSEEERRMVLRERAGTQASGGEPAMGVLQLLRAPAMIGMMLTQGCAVYTQYLFLTWLPNYLQTERGMTMLKSGAVMVLPYLGAVVITIILGRISDALLTPQAVADGRRRTMVVATMLCAAVILAVPFVNNVVLVLLLIMVALGGVASAVGLNISLLNDLLRSAPDTGRATGLLILGGNVFGILAPVVTGYAVEATGGFNAAFVIAGLLLVCGALASFLLARKPIEPAGAVALAQARPV
ncbi:MAG TPA: MFS transporter [Roseomonas sp.]|nr:MFS transporter [Roseomonas sp.]